MLFQDRADAGQRLAKELEAYAGRDDVTVLALPRGGVPVAYQVARALRAPLGLFIVRKLGLPGREELAMGAIATGGVLVLNQDLLDHLNVPDSVIDYVAEQERHELERRERAYRGDAAPPEVRDRIVILVDDGLATGATMRAAVTAVKQQGPARVVVAVPTASPESCDDFRDEVDEVVCAVTPRPFFGVGRWYVDFSQTSDEEVRNLLSRARETLPPLPRREPQPSSQR